jgi:hypothetical protein
MLKIFLIKCLHPCFRPNKSKRDLKGNKEKHMFKVLRFSLKRLFERLFRVQNTGQGERTSTKRNFLSQITSNKVPIEKAG